MTQKCFDETDYVFSLNDLHYHINRFIRLNGYRPTRIIANDKFIWDLTKSSYNHHNSLSGFTNGHSTFLGLNVEYCDELSIYLK